MNRLDFLKKTSLLGAGIALMPCIMTSCLKEINIAPAIDYEGEVIIVGAGAAGMMAAYRLARNNVKFKLIEAGDDFGGRVKKVSDFADVPFDIGAEWIHTRPKVLAELLNNPEAAGSIDTVPYNVQDYKSWYDGKMSKGNIFQDAISREYKFKRTTWYDFFADYIIPVIGTNNLLLNSPVSEIDYSADRVKIILADGGIMEADKILITPSVNVLNDGVITFNPPLPESKRTALKEYDLPGGIKGLIEFSEKFYPDYLSAETEFGQVDYFNAVFKKDTDKHIMAILSTEGSEYYTSLGSDNERIAAFLSELDTIFDGKASSTYRKHIFYDWGNTPYIRGTWTHNSVPESVDQEMMIPVDGKLCFAGEAFSGSTVHGAGFNGHDQIAKLIQF